MIGIVWFISILWIIPITAWSYITNNGKRIVPENECDTEYKHNLAFKLITATFNFYVPLFAMIIINAKIYIVIRKRYHNPIMQYTSGPNSKYSWEQPRKGSSPNIKIAIGSMFGITAAVALNKKKSNPDITKLDHVEISKNSDNEIKNFDKKLIELNKKMTVFRFRKKINQNKTYKNVRCNSSERYTTIYDYDNRNPSPIYTPIKGKKYANIELKYSSLNGEKTIQNLQLKQSEDEVLLKENLKIDEYYNNLLNENLITTHNKDDFDLGYIEPTTYDIISSHSMFKIIFEIFFFFYS
jgi:hypothetical protein